MRLSRNQAVWNNCALSGSAFQHWYTCHITTKVVCKKNFKYEAVYSCTLSTFQA